MILDIPTKSEANGSDFFEEMGVNVPNISPVQCFISCNG